MYRGSVDRTYGTETERSLQDLLYWQQQAEAMIQNVAQASYRSSTFLNYDPNEDSGVLSCSMASLGDDRAVTEPVKPKAASHGSSSVLNCDHTENSEVSLSVTALDEDRAVKEPMRPKTANREDKEAKKKEERKKTANREDKEAKKKEERKREKKLESDAENKNGDSTFLDLFDLTVNPFDEETFLSMIQKQPELVQRKYRLKTFGHSQLYPLHILCTIGASVKCLKACYKAHPAAAIDSHVGLPLHFLATCNGLPEVVHFLAKKDRVLLTHANKKGKTPLHLACEHGAAPQVVQELTAHGPKACEMKDKEGRTPLHWACATAKPNLEVIEDLIATSPGACQVQDKMSLTPLLLALQNGKCPMDVVRSVTNANPQAAAYRNTMDKMSTALNVAVTQRLHDLTLPALKDLIRAHPKALQMKDGQGRIPLHAALDCGAKAEIIRALVKKWPTAVEVRNKRGEIPHEAAVRLKREASLIEFLYPYEDDN